MHSKSWGNDSGGTSVFEGSVFCKTFQKVLVRFSLTPLVIPTGDMRRAKVWTWEALYSTGGTTGGSCDEVLAFQGAPVCFGTQGLWPIGAQAE